jgi:plasmid maintenance system killer protein
MKLFYSSKKLARSVANLPAIAANYGTHARLVNQRKNELEAAPNLSTMRSIPAAHCHELTGKLKGKLSVSISGNHRIIFKPAHDPVPTKEDGGLDWSRVTEITILDIGVDYH